EPGPRAPGGGGPAREPPSRPARRPCLRHGALRTGDGGGAREPLRPVRAGGLRHSPPGRRRRPPPLDEPGLRRRRGAFQGGGEARAALGRRPRGARLRPLPGSPDPRRGLAGQGRELRRRDPKPSGAGPDLRGRCRQGRAGRARPPRRERRLSRRRRRGLRGGLPPARLARLARGARPRPRAPDLDRRGPGRERRL
ncbi:MAG: Segregation and condensation protein B, partial [uncultured Rubrobacteraceae bacterium]